MAVAPPILSTLSLSYAAVVSGKIFDGVPTSPRALAKSFSEVVDNGGKLSVKTPGLFKGEPAVFFSKEDISKLASPFRFTLVGKFTFRRPTMDIIRKFFISLGLKSLKSVGLLQDNHIIIFVNHEEDYSRLLLRASWYISGSPLKIMKWSIDFFPNIESPIVPVWLALSGLLPIHFFEKSALFSLASVFGTPLKTDEPTAYLTRPTVARICVEIDVSKPRHHRLWIGDDKGKEGFWHEVLYENPPAYCEFCKVLGHEVSVCFVKNPELKVLKEKNKTEGKNPVQNLAFPVKAVEKSSSQSKIPQLVEGEDGEWKTHFSKKWKKKEVRFNYGEVLAAEPQSKTAKVVEVVATEEVPKVVESLNKEGNSSIAKGVDVSVGIALTPFNPQNSFNFSKPKTSDNGLLLKQGTKNSQKKGKINSSVAIVENASKEGGKKNPSPAMSLAKEISVPSSSQIWSLQIDRREMSLPKNSVSQQLLLQDFKSQPSISPDGGDMQFQPSTSLSGGSHTFFGELKNSSQPLLLESDQIQPPNLVSLSITHGSGSHELICETNSQKLDVSETNLIGSGLPKISQGTSSSGPNLLEISIGPKINFMDQGKKVHTPYNLIYIQSSLFSFIADHGFKIQPPAHKVIVEFFSLLGPSIEESWTGEVTWFFIQKYFFKFINDSGVRFIKKLRKLLHVFFINASNEDRPLVENLGPRILNQESTIPSVEDAHSDSGESWETSSISSAF